MSNEHPDSHLLQHWQQQYSVHLRLYSEAYSRSRMLLLGTRISSRVCLVAAALAGFSGLYSALLPAACVLFGLAVGAWWVLNREVHKNRQLEEELLDNLDGLARHLWPKRDDHE